MVTDCDYIDYTETEELYKQAKTKSSILLIRVKEPNDEHGYKCEVIDLDDPRLLFEQTEEEYLSENMRGILLSGDNFSTIGRIWRNGAVLCIDDLYGLSGEEIQKLIPTLRKMAKKFIEVDKEAMEKIKREQPEIYEEIATQQLSKVIIQKEYSKFWISNYPVDYGRESLVEEPEDALYEKHVILYKDKELYEKQYDHQSKTKTVAIYEDDKEIHENDVQSYKVSYINPEDIELFNEREEEYDDMLLKYTSIDLDADFDYDKEISNTDKENSQKQNEETMIEEEQNQNEGIELEEVGKLMKKLPHSDIRIRVRNFINGLIRKEKDQTKGE